jgi:tetraacyldisaccharide 4'-kinase
MCDRFSIWIQQQWVRISVWHILLIPLSWLFWIFINCRRKAYEFGLLKSYRPLVPLIVVGNISVGGTGKTPLVIWLVEQLRQAGYRPAVISRGYGAIKASVQAVCVDSLPTDVGDEPVLLAKRTGCPVWVGADRVAVQRELLKAHPDCNVLISDDGLQHYRMQRDIELVVVDAARGFGNGWLLPAGPLREPLARLSSVDALVYNGDQEHSVGYGMMLQAGAIHNLLEGGLTIDVAALQGLKIHAVAGIGNPQRFFKQLQDLGLLIETHVFPDHHAFRAEDMAFGDDAPVLMTEKDAVKCAVFARSNWWYLPVDAEVDHALVDYVIHKLRK